MSQPFVNKPSLIIDIGGTNIKIYYHKENYASLSYSIQTPKNANGLHSVLVDYISSCEYDIFYIGLPGPIYGGEKQIFLPPLDYSFNIREFLACLPGKSIFIENDCSLLHKIVVNSPLNLVYSKDGSTPDTGSICISIGTSFGISGMTHSGGLVSLEMAHIPIESIFNMSGICPQYCRSALEQVCVRDVLNSITIVSLRNGLAKLGIDIKDEADCVALITGLVIGASALAARLLGINDYRVYIVTGIYENIGELFSSTDIHNCLRHDQENIQSISIFAQNHLDGIS